MALVKRTLNQPTVIRLDTVGGTAGWFLLMNHVDKGWSSNCIPYKTLTALIAEWDIVLGEHGRDDSSVFIHAYPRPKVGG